MDKIEDIIRRENIKYTKYKNRIVIKKPKGNGLHEKIFSKLEDEGNDIGEFIFYYSDKKDLIIQYHPVFI